MKNIFIVLALFFATSISAQTFTPVDSVKQKSETEFIAYVGSNQFSISAREFVVFQQEKHFLVEFTGKRPFNIFVSEKKFTDEYLTVKKVGLSGDSVVVLFNNNTTYKTPKKQWLDVLEGQVVRHIKIYSSKRNFERYITVDDDITSGTKDNTGKPATMSEKPKIEKGNVTSTPLAKQTIEVTDTLVTKNSNNETESFNLSNFRLIQK